MKKKAGSYKKREVKLAKAGLTAAGESIELLELDHEAWADEAEGKAGRRLTREELVAVDQRLRKLSRDSRPGFDRYDFESTRGAPLLIDLENPLAAISRWSLGP